MLDKYIILHFKYIVLNHLKSFLKNEMARAQPILLNYFSLGMEI